MTDETLKTYTPTYRISVHMFDETDDCFSNEVRYGYDLKKQEAYKKYKKYVKGSTRPCTQHYKTESDAHKAGLNYVVTLRQCISARQCSSDRNESDIILDYFYTKSWGDCRTT